MKILLATGIFVPEIGGPAGYVLNLARELTKLGHKIQLVTYSDQFFYELDKDFDFVVSRVIRRAGVLGKFLNYYHYYKKLKEIYAKDNFDILYAFDHFSAGLPASCLAKKIKKPFVIRVGGDFLWEKMVNNGKCDVALAEYYQQPKSLAEKVYLKIFQYVFRQADKIIFNTAWQKKLYEDIFLLPADKNLVIHNVFTKADKLTFVDSKEIIFAGRFIKLKNIENLIQAFSHLKTDKELVIIGDGPEKQNLENLSKNYPNIKIENQLSAEKLKERIAHCYAFVLPSLSEVSPNAALEALSLGKFVILSKNNGLAPELQGCFYLIDPLSVTDIKKALEFCLDQDNYSLYLRKISECNFSHSLGELVKEHLDVFNSL
jgi:glycosyltransferase involved in cell wall biosynthesis